MNDPVAGLRSIAAANASDIAGIDAHLAAVVAIVNGVEYRWKRHSDEGGDPRLQHKHFGKLAMRYEGGLAAMVLNRLRYLLGAQHSPFTPNVTADLDLHAIGQHDLAVVEANITAFETENRRFA